MTHRSIASDPNPIDILNTRLGLTVCVHTVRGLRVTYRPIGRPK